MSYVSHQYTPLSSRYCFTKPELIFMLEQGEDPWLLEKEFINRSSPEEFQPDELLEESLENQGKRLRQVLFINKSLTMEQEISGKPCTLDINIFPAETIPCKFDTTGSTYLLLSSLAPHCQYSKKTYAPNNAVDITPSKTKGLMHRR
ncbi:hypothetical protein E5288_WYG022198 [Bos mutus]|uniref:KRAB domain-containing protein n=1 Tax=Bos mutus TaxID=72004 RepID=A0A6B0RHU5_9CETA|nr:hypothetical protein [Bos mutus]